MVRNKESHTKSPFIMDSADEVDMNNMLSKWAKCVLVREKRESDTQCKALKKDGRNNMFFCSHEKPKRWFPKLWITIVWKFWLFWQWKILLKCQNVVSQGLCHHFVTIKGKWRKTRCMCAYCYTLLTSINLNLNKADLGHCYFTFQWHLFVTSFVTLLRRQSRIPFH